MGVPKLLNSVLKHFLGCELLPATYFSCLIKKKILSYSVLKNEAYDNKILVYTPFNSYYIFKDRLIKCIYIYPDSFQKIIDLQYISILLSRS